MKKKLLFSMAAISILAVGLLIWSCGDDGGPAPCTQTISLAASPATINADDSFAGTTITITATFNCPGTVAFKVTEWPTGSTASVPAAGVAVASGEAATDLSAGTIAGEIVVKGTVGDLSDEVTVTLTAGALAGIIEGPIGVITCPTIGFTFTAQLADDFENSVEEAGVNVTFSTDNGELAETTDKTDVKGQATAVMAEGVTAVVTATYNTTTVTFDQVTIDDPLLVPPTAEEIEGEKPPSFRTNTAVIDPDTNGNILGVINSFVNADLDGAMKDGGVNLIYATMGLEDIAGTTDIMFVGVMGLCEAPDGPSTIPCTGIETDYYIDPDSLDGCGYPLIFTKGTVTDGALLVTLGELELSFPVGEDIVPLKLCDVELVGTVTMAPWAIAGNIIEGTIAKTCQDGCASLSGFITVDELCTLVDVALPGVGCDLALGLLGDTDGDCSGDPAYSMRLLFKANAATLFKAP